MVLSGALWRTIKLIPKGQDPDAPLPPLRPPQAPSRMTGPLLWIAAALLASGAVIAVAVRVGDRARRRQSDATEAAERKRRLLRRRR